MTSVSSDGGFLRQELLSPSLSAASNAPTTLPRTRSNPLKSGSFKEKSFIMFVDQELLEISRRYRKRFKIGLADKPVLAADDVGYESFVPLAKDMESIIDVIWVSGTPWLQTPYLFTIASNVQTYLTSFSFSPRSSFRLLHKLDMAFTSLLRGVDVETGLNLSGFEGGRGKLSTTEKVRLTGLVQGSRLTVVKAAARGNNDNDIGRSSHLQRATNHECPTDDDTDDMTDDESDGDFAEYEMEIARVYQSTLVELGSFLDEPGVERAG